MNDKKQAHIYLLITLILSCVIGAEDDYELSRCRFFPFCQVWYKQIYGYVDNFATSK